MSLGFGYSTIDPAERAFGAWRDREPFFFNMLVLKPEELSFSFFAHVVLGREGHPSLWEDQIHQFIKPDRQSKTRYRFPFLRKGRIHNSQ